jgi:DNA-binding NarL/FixJ family response regulator
MYKIMIVDDESIERDALKYIIKQSELEINEIEEACSGREAIEKAMLFKPDIMLIDIKMPGINGIEAVKRIKQIFPDLQVLFLTAFNYFNYAQEAIKVGAKEFVVKPATNDQIIQALEGIINNLKKDQERKFREREAKTRLEQVTNYFESELVALLSIAGNDISQAEEYLNILGLRMEKAVAIVAEINYSAGEIPVVSALQKGMIKKRCMVKLKAEFEKENIKTLVWSYSMPPSDVLHKRYSLTLNRMRYDDCWFSSVFLRFDKRFLYLCNVMPVRLNNIPSKSFKLLCKRIYSHHIFHFTVYLKLVLIHYSAQVIQLIVSCGHDCLPYLAFLHLSVSHKAIRTDIFAIHPCCKRDANSH